jgi:hypothetical protein
VKTGSVKKVVRRVKADVRKAGRKLVGEGKVLIKRAKSSLRKLGRKAAAGREAWRRQD